MMMMKSEVQANIMEKAISGEETEAQEEEGKDEECECCGLVEACTRSYVAAVKKTFCGKWVCGLCAAAVQEERHRLGGGAAALEDALQAHMTACLRFKNLRRRPASVTASVLDPMRQLLLLFLRRSSSSSSSSPSFT